MIGQTKAHFEQAGLGEVEVAEKIEEARGYFTLSNYALQSALSALFLGIFLAGIIMLFPRGKPGGAAG